jgi:Secretion system C-terminal sorting domain
MKQTLLLVFSLAAGGAYAQSAVNSGAASGNSLIHSVGEIYVLPAGNANRASSGTIGAVSRIEFFVLGVDEVIADKGIKIYPNPTTHSVSFETADVITSIEVYDIGGRLVASQKIQKNQADLSGLQCGTYIIKTNNDRSFKVIKK